MTLLEIVTQFCQRTGLDAPSAVMASQDPQILQIVGLLEELCGEITTRKTWQRVTFEANWTSVATESQGVLTTLAPNEFSHIIKDTLWDRTSKLPLYGGQSEQAWQRQKAQAGSGPFRQYRIQEGSLLVQPTLSAGLDMYFEYASHALVVSADGSTYKRLFTVDTDVFLLDQEIALQGLRWKWKAEKGLPYKVHFDAFELALMNANLRDKRPKALNMAGTETGYTPAVLIPAGDWPLT